MYRYKIEVTEEINNFEDVFFIGNQVINLGLNLNISYIDKKVTIFCNIHNTARKISSTISESGFACSFHFTEEIKI
jgi:hypothetical protein